ncbi:MAG: pyridoxamine 5'-phosphate oxidase family protein [Acutalibacteraceae bacterium]
MNSEFEKQVSILFEKFGSHSVMTLSTGSGSRISSRAMSVIIYNESFYFQTDENYLKFKQLAENPNAALCIDNYSIEGRCTVIGAPLDEENAFFAEAFKKHFYFAYKAYSELQGERLIKFTPTLIYSWNYINSKPYMEYFDFENKTYRIENK